ncbi:hypothetical protein TRVL_07175 [Trypanosoma vivax]|nr:hypothetical protein TRVL_07175 [Trypanosoma vivax]
MRTRLFGECVRKHRVYRGASFHVVTTAAAEGNGWSARRSGRRDHGTRLEICQRMTSGAGCAGYSAQRGHVMRPLSVCAEFRRAGDTSTWQVVEPRVAGGETDGTLSGRDRFNGKIGLSKVDRCGGSRASKSKTSDRKWALRDGSFSNENNRPSNVAFAR